jgi:hypothetical protein
MVIPALLFALLCDVWCLPVSGGDGSDSSSWLDAPVLDGALVSRSNARANGLWTAAMPPSHSSPLTFMTRRQARAWLDYPRASAGMRRKQEWDMRWGVSAVTSTTVDPDNNSSFDAAEAWPACQTIARISDQGTCGGCWAVAAAAAMSDRLCISHAAEDGYTNVSLSAVALMSCCEWCGAGCSGGNAGYAWTYWTSNPVPTEACQPYPFPPCAHVPPSERSSSLDHPGAWAKGEAASTPPITTFPPCGGPPAVPPACANGYCTSNFSMNFSAFQGATSYSLEGEQRYREELETNGPFEVTFGVYRDFLSYHSGVYVQTSKELLGLHSVRIVGWGVWVPPGDSRQIDTHVTAQGVPYWKVANSWNADWGMQGYFLIRRGTNECGIEMTGNAGTYA